MVGKEWLVAHLPSGIKNHSMEGEDEALAKLAELGEEGAPVIKEIAAALADPNEYVRRRAATLWADWAKPAQPPQTTSPPHSRTRMKPCVRAPQKASLRWVSPAPRMPKP